MKPWLSLKKGDIFLLVIGMMVLLPLLWFYFNDGRQKPSDGLKAVITRDGKLMAEIDLNSVQEPQTFEFQDGIRVLIVAEKGSIKFVEADCPDKICIKTGTLTKPGDRAICLPSKTIVKVEDN
ncbi:MAG: hypothetical protein APF81_10000 [Desulfosporosinus sp. BRH_c37]|nr:MAG: hypothetical protein APF81_10000 [Desulfosporosinus sp. BRH_c37]